MVPKSRYFRILTSISLAATLCFALACGGEDTSSESAAPSAPSAPARKAPAAEPAPEAEVTEKQVPGNFPNDIPIYPGAESEQSLGIPGGPMLAAFSSSDDPATVLTFYKSELASSGWEIDDPGDGVGALRANKEDRSLTIRVDGTSSGSTSIAIVVRTQG